MSDTNQMTGCSSHACMVSPPKGMGTNSGKCFCPECKVMAVFQRLRVRIESLEAELVIAKMDGFVLAQKFQLVEKENTALQQQVDALQARVHLCAGYDALEEENAALREALDSLRMHSLDHVTPYMVAIPSVEWSSVYASVERYFPPPTADKEG